MAASICFTLPPRLSCPYHPRRISQQPFPLIQSTPNNFSSLSKSRVPATVLRASLDAAIRPGGAVESDKLPSDVRKRTMDAVDSCGGRVTIGDMSSRAGLNLNDAQKALQALAADTQGFLEIYACSYFVIPLLRWFVMLKTNADIEKRNQARQQFARDLELPDLSLRKKLVSARDLAHKMVIGQEKIVYSTERDMDEQYLHMGSVFKKATISGVEVRTLATKPESH